MRCSDVERLLPQFADDALPATQADGIASHLSGCKNCRGELSQLQRSLDALNVAAREPAPDLWAQFQTRLAQSAAAVPCREIETLLPKFVDGELERAQTVQVRDHLAACSACTALEAAQALPMRTLEKVGRAPAAVELWPSFTARLGASLSCREVEELLPAVMAGEPTAQTLPVQYHLHACQVCAESLAAYEVSLSALSRVGQSAPEVDLWPAFSARLEKEASPRRVRATSSGWLLALGTWLRGPLLQPAVGFAAFALFTFGGHLLSQSISGRTRVTGIPRLAQHGPGETVIKEQPVSPAATKITQTPAPTPGSPTDRASVIKSPAETPVRIAAHPAPRPAGAVATPLDDPGSELPQTSGDSRVRVAFNLPSGGGEFFPASENAVAPDLVASTTVSERDGMQAVVQAVGLLAGSEDALNSPFESKANDN